MIGSNQGPAANAGFVGTLDPAGDKWPHQVRKWKYLPYSQGEGGKSVLPLLRDPLLTVTGNISLNILCFN